MLGCFGYVGHVLYFTILLLPLMRFLRSYKKMQMRDQLLCGMLALLLATFVLDLLPNAFSDNLTLVYAGMLYTLSEVFRRRRPKPFKRSTKPLSEREFGGSEPPPPRDSDHPLVTV